MHGKATAMNHVRPTAVLAAVGALLLVAASAFASFGLLRAAIATLPLGVLLLSGAILLSERALAREMRTLRSNASRSHARLVSGLADIAARTDRATLAAENAVVEASKGHAALSEQVRAGHGSTVRALRGLRKHHSETETTVLAGIETARDAVASRLDAQDARLRSLTDSSVRVEEAVLARPIARRAGDLLLAARRPGPVVTTLPRHGLEAALGGSTAPIDLMVWREGEPPSAHTWGGVLLDLDLEVPRSLIETLHWVRPDVPVLGFTRLPFERDRLGARVQCAAAGRLEAEPLTDGILRLHPSGPGQGTNA